MVDQKIRNETMWVWNRLSLLSQADILYMKFKDRWDNGEAMWGSLVIPPTASSYRTFQGWRLGSVLWNLQVWFLLPSFSWLQRMPQSHRPSFHHKICHNQKLHLIEALSKSRWHWWHTGLTQLLDPVNPGSLWWKRVNPMSSVVPEVCSDNALFSSLVETDVQMVI